jgi:hypothetical protein
MKRFSTLTLVLITVLLAAACAPRATPVPTPVDIQSTIAAVAFTKIALTQAAIPTATPIPPTATFTDIPIPTETLPPLPPAGATFTPPPNPNSGGADPCINKVMPTSLPGKTIKVRINNSTRVAVAFSIYLNQTTPQSACGYRTYTIDPGQSLILNDLVEGCYSLWAWNPDPEGYFIATNGTSCLNSTENSIFDISTGSIKLKP